VCRMIRIHSALLCARVLVAKAHKAWQNLQNPTRPWEMYGHTLAAPPATFHLALGPSLAHRTSQYSV
jgi:hypothetical protein